MSLFRTLVLATLFGIASVQAQSGNMLEFTGAANSVSVPHTFSGSSFGYEFWFKANAIGTPMNLVVYSAANGPMVTASHQVRLNSAGRVQFYVYRQDLLTGITITSNRSVTPGEWVHVGVNWVDMAGGELYLDGVLEGSFNGGGVPAQVGVAWKSGINLHFGSATTGLSPFNGNIDEFRIWSGGVGPNTFHPHAITRLASPFPTGLTDYWNFDSATSGAIANVVTGRAAVQMTSGATLAYSALPAFLGGTGSSADPYQVGFAGQLNQVRQHRSAHFIQTKAISLAAYASGAGWTPLATLATPFTGTYNGQNFTISGLTQSGTLSDAGLFGVIGGSAARVRNVRLTGVNISVTGNHVGALAGSLTSQSQVSGSSVEGSISGNVQVGGLIGTLNVGTTLMTSYSLATVSGSDMIGGLVGQPFQATVQNVYSLATVSATSNAGGLFGNAHSSTLQNAYAAATVNGATRGQISGSLSGTNAVSKLYFSNTSGIAGVGTGQAIATAYSPSQLRVPQLFVGWDFNAVWQANSGESTSYPFLRGAVQSPSPGLSTDPLPVLPFAPAQNAVEIMLMPTFEWTAESGATQYEIQIALDEAFADLYVQVLDVNGTSFVPETRMESFQVYYWRVRSRSTEAGEGVWSPVMTFRSASFEGGAGTAADPYQVATAAQLNRVRNFLTAHFIQIADISLDAYTSGSGWTPIGAYVFANPSHAFSGRYNGQFHTITNLTISGSISEAGLFGFLRSPAIIENLRLRDVNITGTGSARGAVAGRTDRANVWRVSVSGSISGNTFVGGVIGYMQGGMIAQSYSDATVSGSGVVGGIVGTIIQSLATSLEDLYSLATVTATSTNAGGIAGRVEFDGVSLTLTRLYSDATVSGPTLIGMIAGSGLAPSRSASRTSVYFSTDFGVPGDGDWLSTSRTINLMVDLPGARTRDQLRDVATYSGFDFNTGWDIKSIGEASYPFLRTVTQIPAPGYLTTPNAPSALSPAWATTLTQPELRWTKALPADQYELQLSSDSLFTSGLVISTTVSGTTFTPASPLSLGPYYWRVRGVNSARNETGAWSATKALAIVAFPAGNGTAGDPYRVATVAQLFATREFRAAHFRQTADINLQPVGHWNPIGSRATPFTGRYDGQRFVISGLTQSGRLSNVGLFGVLSGATVSNVNLTAVQISVALDSVGALAGLAMANSLVQGSSVQGTISGRLEVGGLVGRLFRSNIVTSYSLATVTGVARVGGLAGIAMEESGLSDVYSLATVSASAPALFLDSILETAGGIVGYLWRSSLSNSYADATLINSQSYIGGQLAGAGSSCPSSIRNHFNSEKGNPGVASFSSGDNFCGLGLARTSNQLRSMDSFFGWNFGSTWQINQGTTASYPYLRAAVQSPPPGFLEEGFFAGGTGTSADPYQVATAAHLSNIRFFPNSHFIQTADISLAHIPNWQPIDPANGFNGVYNGQQFRIVGLTISGAVNNAGLFSQTSGQYGTVIENVRLVEVNIQSTGHTVGGLVGYLRSGTVRNSSVSGSITGRNNVGGLIGFVGSDFPPPKRPLQ